MGKKWKVYEKPGLEVLSSNERLLMIDMLDEKTGSAKINSDLVKTYMYLTDDAWETVELMPLPDNGEKMVYWCYSRP